MVDCKVFSERRFRCHSVYGKQGEDCLHEALTEKRCLSMHYCPRQANDFYGDHSMLATPNDDVGAAPTFLTHKAMCSSWAEAFAYADKGLEYGHQVTRHHREAQAIVNEDRRLKRECRDMAFALAQCLRHKTLF